MNYICRVPSPLGVLTLSGEGESLTGLWMEDQKYFASTLKEETEEKSLPVLDAAREWLRRYFAGEEPEIAVPLAPKGSGFRQAVWKILLSIPYGELMTYGEIAARLQKEQGGKAVSAQAVGGGVGRNPISIIIPCHRVVGAGGNLTGYAGGIEKKIFLLRLEKAKTENLFVPKKGTAL